MYDIRKISAAALRRSCAVAVAAFGLLAHGPVLASTLSAGPVRFLHAPTGFRVTSKSFADGSMKLTGNRADGQDFNIIVDSSGWVKGTYLGQTVNYKLSDDILKQMATR